MSRGRTARRVARSAASVEVTRGSSVPPRAKPCDPRQTRRVTSRLRPPDQDHPVRAPPRPTAAPWRAREVRCVGNRAPGCPAPAPDSGRASVRYVLWSCEFPLVEALPSGSSAGAFAPLFAAYIGTPASSDFFIPCTIGYGILLPSAAPVRLPGQNEDLPGPDEGRTKLHGFSDTVVAVGNRVTPVPPLRSVRAR